MMDAFQRKNTSQKSKREKRNLCENEHLKGKNRFRSAVKLVKEYIIWINEDTTSEENNDVTTHFKLDEHKQVSEIMKITIMDRAIMLIKPECRTEEEKAHITNLIKRLKIFTKYPEKLRETFGSICQYQYVPAGRKIVRQGHKAQALYCIIQGEVNLIKNIIDKVTGENNETDVGTISVGDMFGEFALLHNNPRSTTVISKTSVDLLYISREHFNHIMRSALMQEWYQLSDALSNFDYFKGWDESTKRECCIISKIRKFKPNEILLGDGRGMINYVHFILSGECALIEHMFVREKRVGKKTRCTLYDPTSPNTLSLESKKNFNAKIELPDPKKITELASDLFQANADKEKITEDQMFTETQLSLGDINSECKSIATTTLLDVVNQWREITDVVAILLRDVSNASHQQYPKDFHTIFMQVCKFYRGACFGLGEQMQNRRIVSLTPMQCVLIPRYWIFKHNRANIWERIKMFLNSKYPTNDQLFQEYVQNQRWRKYKKRLVKDVIKNGRQINNDIAIYDVPYSIRINK